MHEIRKIDTTRSNAFASKKGRASFLLHLSIQKLNILKVLLYIKIISNTSQTDSNSSNGQILSFSYLFLTFLPLTSAVSQFLRTPHSRQMLFLTDGVKLQARNCEDSHDCRLLNKKNWIKLYTHLLKNGLHVPFGTRLRLWVIFFTTGSHRAKRDWAV